MTTLTSKTTIKYVVKVGNQIKGSFDSSIIAESFKMSLTEDERNNAFIIPMTSDDKQILLG